jgi:hypothetical protein
MLLSPLAAAQGLIANEYGAQKEFGSQGSVQFIHIAGDPAHCFTYQVSLLQLTDDCVPLVIAPIIESIAAFLSQFTVLANAVDERPLLSYKEREFIFSVSEEYNRADEVKELKSLQLP